MREMVDAGTPVRRATSANVQAFRVRRLLNAVPGVALDMSIPYKLNLTKPVTILPACRGLRKVRIRKSRFGKSHSVPEGSAEDRCAWIDVIHNSPLIDDPLATDKHVLHPHGVLLCVE